MAVHRERKQIRERKRKKAQERDGERLGESLSERGRVLGEGEVSPGLGPSSPALMARRKRERS